MTKNSFVAEVAFNDPLQNAVKHISIKQYTPLLAMTIFRSSRPYVFCKKGVLSAKFTGKHLCQSPFFNKVEDLQACNFIKKETVAQVFSCEFCEISKNTFYYRTRMVAATALTSSG